MTQRFPLALATAFATALLLSACGGGGGAPVTPTTGSPSGGSPTSTTTVTPTVTPAPDPNQQSDTSPGDALRGILWNHDEDDGTTPDQQYAFKPTYDIPGVNADGRATYIDEVKRDGEYARRTANDIRLMIDEIREGKDHGDNYYDEDDGEFSRVADQYGHTPGAEGSSLQEFVDAGDQGVAVLVAAQGVSSGIADAALADIAAIRKLIAEYQKYIAKAEAAKKALEDEANRLPSEIAKLIGTDGSGGTAKDNDDRVGKLESEIDGLNTDIATLVIEIGDLDVVIGLLADEIKALEGDPGDLDTSSSIVGLGKAITKLRDEIGELNTDIAALEALFALDTPDFRNAPDCDSRATCTTALTNKKTERTMKIAERTMKEGEKTTKEAERDMKVAERTMKENEKTTKENEKTTKEGERTMKEGARDNARDQAAADRAKARDLQDEADRLANTDVPAIQDEIDAIKTTQTDVRKVLEGVPISGTPADEALVGRLAALGGSTAAELESAKARAVRTYLEGVFERAVATPNSRILLGAGANFVDLVTREATDPTSVFARAPKPTGTVDAWTALGLAEGAGERTLSPDSDNTDLADLIADIGTHRALGLAGKPATADFVLKDKSLQSNYDGTPTRGQNYEGTYKGVHGLLYYDQALDQQSGFVVPKWFFTPTTASGDDQRRLRGKDPELFRYQDNGDGTHTRVDYIDYGMWLADVGSDGAPALGLSLLAGVVGPQEAVDDLGPTVNVFGVRDRDNPNLAASATYSGTAKGLSARTDSEGTSASGHFEANVELKATFGADATLGGTIDNFRSANPAGQGTAHVNDAWSATLDPTALNVWDHDGSPLTDHDNNPNTPDLGTPDAGGQVTGGTISGNNVVSGEWAGTAYGRPGRRPEGFYGGFRVEFPDGSAAGVYDAGNPVFADN